MSDLFEELSRFCETARERHGDAQILGALFLVIHDIAANKKEHLDAVIEVADTLNGISEKSIRNETAKFFEEAGFRHSRTAVCMELLDQIAFHVVTTGDEHLIGRISEMFQENIARYRSAIGSSQH